jgi:hypothetical protein
MNRVANYINWTEIMDKFANHKGSIIDFCKENNIKHSQLYNQRKKLKKTQTFHVIDVSNVNISENNKAAEQSIKIEIGNVKIFIPAEDKNTLLTLIRELAKSC